MQDNQDNQDNQNNQENQNQNQNQENEGKYESDNDSEGSLIIEGASITYQITESRFPYEYKNLYINLMHKFEKKYAIPVYKRETDVCCITLEEIQDNEYYYKCPNCQCNTKMIELKLWLKQNQSCPKCRQMYQVFPNLYQKLSIWNAVKFGYLPGFCVGAGCTLLAIGIHHILKT